MTSVLDAEAYVVKLRKMEGGGDVCGLTNINIV
jgi:hypothetical protein